MIYDAYEVLKLIKPTDRVLDIGGAEQVFPRANAVIDIIPYEDRKPGQIADVPEQFTKDDWYTGDICAPEIWSHFEDKSFDFVICSHVLEDIRDPIYVCEQMVRIGKAGYIECPSRFRECAKGASWDPVSGWEHHRWILDVRDGTLIFTPKLHWANQFDYLGFKRRHYLSDYWFQFTAVHWIGSFDYVEHVFRGSVMEVENQFYFYDSYPYDHHKWLTKIVDVPHRGHTFLWFSDYKLPIEEVYTHEEILQRHAKRQRAKKAINKIQYLFLSFLSKLGTAKKRFWK